MLNLIASGHDFLHYGGTDFRARVVGARALLRGIDPYSLNDSEDLPPELRDPHQTHIGLSRCTYPPTLLLACSPLAMMPYRIARGTSMILEWAALLAIIGLLTRTLNGDRTRYLFVVSTLFLVAAAPFWRLHVERGQYYIFVGLLLAISVWMSRRDGGTATVWSGIAIGLAVALRGNVALLLIPLWIAGRRRTVFAATATIAVCVLLTFPVAGLEIWSQYFSAVKQWERYRLDTASMLREFPLRETQAENVDGFQHAVLPSRSASITVPEISGQIARKTTMTPEWGRIVVRAGALAIVATIVACFWRAHRRRACSTRETYLAGFLLILLTDFFVPIRVGYVDVMFCLPAAMLMPLFARPRWRLYSLLIIAACLLSVVPVPPDSNSYWSIATALRSAVFLGVCCGMTATILGGRRLPGNRAGSSQ